MKTSNLFKIILFGPILIVSQLLFGQLYTPSGTVNAVTNGSTTNVGIGTSTPTQSIHVGIGNIQLPIGSSSSTGSIIFGGDPYLTGIFGMRIFHSGTSGGGFFDSKNYLAFRADNNTGTTERMRIATDGKVSIGISSVPPDCKFKVYDSQFPMLQVAGPANSGEASIFLATAPANYYYSNSAIAGDVVLSTGGGTTTNLLIQASRANQNIKFITNYGNYGGVRMMLNNDGKVFIGHTDPVKAGGYLLSVAGKVLCEELKVKLYTSWPDFVFAKNYGLMPLDSVETFIEENNHLPNVPAAAEVNENGINTGEMFSIQMRKIEELTLYLIELQKQNEELKKRIELLEKQ